METKEELTLPAEIINLSTVQGLLEATKSKDLISLPEFSDSYEVLNNTIEVCSQLKALIDANIKSKAEENYLTTGESSISSSKYKFVYVPGSTRETFNSKALKADDPETYKKYVKINAVSSSLRTYKIEDTKTEEDK